VPEDYWAVRPIQYLSVLQIMSGYPDKTFHPEKAFSRGELAALLVKAKGFSVEEGKNGNFKDVNSRDWQAPYIEIAVQREYMKGYPDGSFRPSQKITRAEAAVVFANYTGIYVKPKLSENPFPDVSRKHWAAPAIAACKGEGFFEYLSGRDFEPDREITRAEAAEICSKTPLIKAKIKNMLAGEE
jgi:hypothetical protein